MNDKKHEVEYTYSAADCEVKVELHAQNQWHFHVTGLVFGNGEPHREETKTFILTDRQASATLALTVGELEEEQDRELTRMLYEIAETAWKDVPQHLRIIP